jgi:hypothetical protein
MFNDKIKNKNFQFKKKTQVNIGYPVKLATHIIHPIRIFNNLLF